MVNLSCWRADPREFRQAVSALSRARSIAATAASGSLVRSRSPSCRASRASRSPTGSWVSAPASSARTIAIPACRRASAKAVA